MDWTLYLKKDGFLNFRKYEELNQDPEFILLKSRYPWCKSVYEFYYCYQNDITEQPKCYCGNHISFSKQRKYNRGCSPKCIRNLPESLILRKNKNLEKYGCEYAFQAEEVKKKIAKTNLQKYGCINPAQNSEIYDKVKQTNLQKYGVKFVTQSQIVRNKRHKTNLQKYGHIEHLSSNLVKDKRVKTNLSKWGVTCNLQAPDTLKKIKTARQIKYGCYHHKQKHISKDIRKLMWDKRFLLDEHHKFKKPISQISKELGINSSNLCVIFKKLGIPILYFDKSIGEKELFDYISIIISPLISFSNDRTILNPYELDIYIPELKLAFEYDGEFWHRNSRERDRWKTFRCKELGITLYHIHERFWLNEQERMKQIISNIINKRLTVIFK